jgi:carboxyl-terminal processing protease
MSRRTRLTRREWVLFSLILLFTLPASFIAGYFTKLHFSQEAPLPVFHQAYELLQQYAYYPLPDPPALEYGAIRGMLQAYNEPYTVFLEPAAHELQTNSLEGKYGGIGVRLDRDEAGYIVLYPIPDSPADKAGVMEGDRLVSVEQLTISLETPLEEAQAALRGPVRQSVTLSVLRPPEVTPLSFTIRREEFPLPSVTWHLDASESRLGVIEINLIAASTKDELRKAIQDLSARGATNFALDLRGNSGGLLDVGVDLAGLFLREGELIRQRRRGEDTQILRVNKPGPYANLPLFVLIDQNTASAAEILAGSLKSHQRAIVIGRPTMGKESIQLIFTLQDGSSLHITNGRWWIPNLSPPIAHHGIQPDILIDTSAEPSVWLQPIRELLRGAP